MSTLLVLAAWPVASIPLALFVGAFIRAGQRPRDTRPPNRHTDNRSHQ